MSFLSSGSKAGNFLSGAAKRLPGLISNGSQIAQGFANIFDPSGGMSQKIGNIAQGAQNFMGQGGDTFGNMRNQWNNRDFGGLANSFGGMLGNAGGAMSQLGGSVGGKFGRGMQQAGGYMGRGSDIASGMGSMYDSGRAMVGNMRDRMSQGMNQLNQRDYNNFGSNVGGGVADMLNFGNQMMNQGQSMLRGSGAASGSSYMDQMNGQNAMTPRRNAPPALPPRRNNTPPPLPPRPMNYAF